MRDSLGLLIALGACGRISFDAHTDTTGTDGAVDAVDAVDAAIPCTAVDETEMAAFSGVSGFVWTGDGYAILSYSGLATLSEAGVLGAFQQLVPAVMNTSLGGQGIAWSGSELAVVWTGSTGPIELGFFDASLAPIGGIVQLGDANAFTPSVIWTGDVFAVTWIDDESGQLQIAEVDASGAVVDSVAHTGTAEITSVYAIVSTGASYLVAVYEGNGSVATIVTAPKPLADPVTEAVLDLGPSGTGYLQLANASSGAVALQANAISGPGELELLDASGSSAGSGQALPTDGGNDLQYATAIPLGAGARVIGVTDANPAQIVTSDYDPIAEQFGSLTELGTFSWMGYGSPAAAVGPGRIAIAELYLSSTGGALRLIQQCQ